MPKCDRCGCFWENPTVKHCPMCHQDVEEAMNIELLTKGMDLLTQGLNRSKRSEAVLDFIQIQAILCEQLDIMLYIPFKKLLGDDLHRFGIQKEKFKALIEQTIMQLQSSIRIELEIALNDCCASHCRFCYQDDEWKFEILGGWCEVAKLRKKWQIKDDL